ncbi:flagellar biosynthesis protein FlhF [Halobacillus seohaensis]|uniref:Flagellar biosynthesis protein FlhF n=1 Tax=Halobacillus seohaensis TaxID=447421 RepID=A0ABW2EIH2_9BACI
MKVKKFQGPSMPEVMKKVKKNLGNDAVILNSKEIKTGGFLGMFKKTQTEVIAAIDPVPDKGKLETTSPKREPQLTSSESEGVVREIRQLKAMIQQQSSSESDSTSLDRMHKHLLDQELDEEICQDIKHLLLGEFSELSFEQLSEEQVHLSTYNHLIKQLENIAIGDHSFTKKFVHLVGPTGVGKTTTVAKLAADAVLNKNLKVGFITTDTYRIAAIDQLKTYAKILDIPLEVAYNLDDYMEARAKFDDYDLVFIDTAGRNFRDSQYVSELKKMINFNENTETYLVLSLTSKYQDMLEIFHQFNQVPIERLIFTKSDETSRIGGALSLAVTNNIGIAYITYGQDVPDDIDQADSGKLIRSVTEGFSYE